VPHAGLTIVVTAIAGGQAKADALALALASRTWHDRARFDHVLTPLADAPAPCVTSSHARAAGRARRCRGQPGGGGRANTMWLAEVLHGAGMDGRVVGLVWEPYIVAEAFAAGEGRGSLARF